MKESILSQLSAEVQEALQASDAALATNPMDEAAWLSRARLLAQKAQRIDLAVLTCSRALTYLPGSGELHLARGHYYINVGRPEEASADLAQARIVLGDTWQVMYHLALSLYLSHEYERAEAMYRHMLIIFPTDTAHIPLMNWLWACLVHQGRLEEAAEVSASVGADWDPGADAAYHRVQLFASGRMTLEKALGGSTVQNDIESITTGYGVYNYFRYVKKDTAKADEILNAILTLCTGPLLHCFAYQSAMSEKG